MATEVDSAPLTHDFKWSKTKSKCQVNLLLTNISSHFRHPPLPRVPSLFGHGLISSAQVVLLGIHNKRSADHIPDLQMEKKETFLQIVFPVKYQWTWWTTFTWLSSNRNEALPSGPATIFPKSPTCCNSSAQRWPAMVSMVITKCEMIQCHQRRILYPDRVSGAPVSSSKRIIVFSTTMMKDGY